MKKIDRQIHIEPLAPDELPAAVELAGSALGVAELLELLLRIRRDAEEDLPVIA